MLFTKVISLALVALFHTTVLAAPTSSIAVNIEDNGYNPADFFDITFKGSIIKVNKAFILSDNSATNVIREIDQLAALPEDFCGSSTFYSTTTSASPKLSDCANLVAFAWAQHSLGEVRANAAYQRLLSLGTCVFGIRNTGRDWNYIGSKDISDVIGTSISKGFAKSGKISAKGEMPCGRGTIYQGTKLV